MQPELTAPLKVRYLTLACGGDDAVHSQAAMVMLSLMAYAPEPRELVVVTDRPECYEWLQWDVRVQPVSAAQLAEWRGKDPHTMRQKLEVARAMMPSAGALVMLDPHTIVRGDLSEMVERLGKGSMFLLRREFQLGYSRRRANMALWKEISTRTFAGWYFRPGDAMWNSAIIGVPVTEAALIDEAIRLYDAINDAGIRKPAVEQLVLGQVLGRSRRLGSAFPWVRYYWQNRKAFDAEIANRLREAHASNLRPSHMALALRRNPIDLPSEVRPGLLERMGLWFRRRFGQTPVLPEANRSARPLSL